MAMSYEACVADVTATEPTLAEFYEIARSRPSHYVCEKCLYLHCPCSGDVPGASGHAAHSCPLERECPNSQAGVGFPKYLVRHHHVQLAVKLSKMEYRDEWHEGYLSRLLDEHRVTDYPCAADPTLERKLEIRPRVVRGRYILAAHTAFESRQQPVLLPEGIDYVKACNHQVFCGLSFTDREPKTQTVRPYDDIYRTVRAASQSQDTWVTSSCPYCPTDFAVKFAGNRVRVSCWLDLGEGERLDERAWLAQKCQDTDGPLVSYQNYTPGSTRRRFREADRCSQVQEEEPETRSLQAGFIRMELTLRSSRRRSNGASQSNDRTREERNVAREGILSRPEVGTFLAAWTGTAGLGSTVSAVIPQRWL